MFRLFVGIALPDWVRQELDGVCEGLPGARWVDAETMHITVRFIGEVDGGMADDVHDALCRVSAPAFSLVMTGVDCFEQAGKVHTLWVGVEKQPLLSRLRDKVEYALIRAGLDPERRKFKPHVTLARFRNGDPDRLGAYLQRNSRFATAPFLIDAFTLFRSYQSAGGPHYEALMRYPLAASEASMSAGSAAI